MHRPRPELFALCAVGLALSSACVDKAPPATWPEPPPPVLAAPVGGEEAKVPSARVPDEPSEALEGTNDPKEGAVGLEEAPAAEASEPPSTDEPAQPQA